MNRPAGRTGDRSKRLFIVLAVVIGLGLLFVWNTVFLSPRGREEHDVRAKLANARSEERTLRASLTQLRRLAADSRAEEAELARLGRLVPADPDVDGAILALNDLAAGSHVAWSSFVPTPAVPGAGAGPATVGISMKINGTYAQILDYLRRLETLERLVVVDDVNLAGGPGPDGAVVLSVDLKARMFAVAAPTAASAAAPDVKAGG